MKKINMASGKAFAALAVLATAFTMASCSREPLIETENNATPVEGNCIITAFTENSLNDNTTRTALNGSDSEGYNVVWSSGDKITIGDNEFTLIAGENTTKGTFQGDLPAEDGTYTACYPATYNGEDWPASQTYTANNITGSPMTASVTVSGGEVSEKSLSFTNKGGILRLTVKGSENILVQSITVSAKDLEDITLNCGDGVALNATDGTVFHIAMPYGEYSKTSILISSKDSKCCVKSLSSKDLVIERSKITRASFTANDFKELIPEGALPETFTVSANGKKVLFSKGNLWCDTDTDPAAGNFHFEDNQYDTTPTTNKDRSLSHISHFMWCRSATDAVKAGYSETDMSTDDILFTNVAGFTVNGAGNWYAPSHDEMDYLLMSRKASTIGGKANARYFSGRIDKGSGNYANGLFIIPDVFTWPESELPNAPKGINEYKYNYTDNTYSVSEFAVLQQAGVVFMPCAGSRDGYFGYSSVNYVNNSGYYWYSTLNSADKAGHLGFSVGGGVLEDSSNERNKAYSIRLVTDPSNSQTPSFTVSFDMNGHGTAPANITGVQYRSTITEPEEFQTDPGYGFAGWYKDKGCKTKWDFSSDIVTANTTLYAGWMKLLDGALNGQFTVNENGDQVYFSKGNMYWNEENTSFEFETSQTNCETQWNSHVSHFFWSKNKDKAREYEYSDKVSYGDVFFTNVSGFTANGQTDVWRTLSTAEWQYILGFSSDGTNIAHRNVTNRFAKANVDGVNGLLIFPDVFKWNESTMGNEPEYNMEDNSFSNTYSTDNFTAMQNAGVVFLPSAGSYYRRRDRREDTEFGYYWTSTLYSSYSDIFTTAKANSLFFGNEINPSGIHALESANCIRLVTDCPNAIISYTVTFDMNGKTGTAPESLQDVPYASTIAKPSNPTTTGYSFAGWYTDENCTTLWNFDSGEVTSNITLYAAWIPNDVLHGIFTVNSNGKQVYFSKGNLWADGSKVLHFESGQSDYNSNYEASHVSHFTWSDNVTSAVSNGHSGDHLFCDESHKVSVDDSEAIYYALSKDELIYLFNHHENKWATVNGKYGQVIAPDGFTGTLSDSYADETALATYNLLFLPAAGDRDSFYGGMELTNEYGFYWSSSNDDQGAFFVMFQGGGVHADMPTSSRPEVGLGLRLVTNIR